MKMRKENVLVIILICMAFAGGVFYKYSDAHKTQSLQSAPEKEGSSDSTTGIDWVSMEEGLARAETEDKPIFLYFHASWCTYCVKLKKTTFKDKKVQQVLAQNFVSISIDTDKNRDLATQWRVTGLPTLWFLKPDGSKIERIPGYVDPGQMVKILRFVDSKQYEQVSFHDFIKRL